MRKPLAIDLFCGLGGWTDGLLAEGWDVIGFDIEQHSYGGHRYPAQLVVQDVLTLHGAQFRSADLIVASPPCTEFSYMAMPWTRAKAIAAALRGEGAFPEGYAGSRSIAELTRLFDACFRIQREASEAAGGGVPMVVENVRGAQDWVGRARWSFGSFYLWGDVPALMPKAVRAAKRPGHNWNRFKETGEVSPHWRLNGEDSAAIKNTGGSWFNIAHNTTSGVGQNPDGRKTRGHINIRDGACDTRHLTNPAEHGIKQPGLAGGRDNGKGDRWFQDGAARSGSKSSARKEASARIAKIPLPLALHIARVFRPASEAA